MVFPDWIEATRPKKARASLRLKFLLQQAALLKYGRTSMHDLARDAGCHHSSIFNAISRGSFTEEMAQKIVDVLGKNVIRNVDYLTSPLEIGAKAST